MGCTDRRTCSIGGTMEGRTDSISNKTIFTMEQTHTPLSIFLDQLLVRHRRVQVVPDQARCFQPLPKARGNVQPRHCRRRSMDMICRIKDTSPCLPNRRGSMDVTTHQPLDVARKVSVQPPRMPTRRRSLAGAVRPGIPHQEERALLLMASPMA